MLLTRNHHYEQNARNQFPRRNQEGVNSYFRFLFTNPSRIIPTMSSKICDNHVVNRMFSNVRLLHCDATVPMLAWQLYFRPREPIYRESGMNLHDPVISNISIVLAQENEMVLPSRLA